MIKKLLIIRIAYYFLIDLIKPLRDGIQFLFRIGEKEKSD
jgi:hypothetical protein